MKKTIVFLGIFFLASNFILAKDVAEITGTPKSVSFLENIGVVTFSGSGKKSLLDISGNKSTISGKDYTLDASGKLKKAGTGKEISAIKAYAKNITVKRVKVTGKQEKLEYPLDINSALTNLFKNIDDENIVIKINKSTVYEGGNIGSPTDPKIVVVDSADVTFQGDFTGYGVIILTQSKKITPISSPIFIKRVSYPLVKFYDKAKCGAMLNSVYKLVGYPSVKFYDKAKWQGLIISDSDNGQIHLGIRLRDAKYYKRLEKRYEKDYKENKKLYQFCSGTKIKKDKKDIRKISSRRCQRYKTLYEKYYALYEKFKKLAEQAKTKQDIQVLGAVLAQGKKLDLSMYNAKLLYSSQTIDNLIKKTLIEGKIGSNKVLPIDWKKYKKINQ